MLLVSPSVQDLHESPGGPCCAEPLEVEVLKNIIKCGSADMTADPLRALNVVRKDFVSPSLISLAPVMAPGVILLSCGSCETV